MRLEKIPRARQSILARCHNGCRTQLNGVTPGQPKSSDCGYRSASHIAWIIGRKTLLCKDCAKDWQRIWDSALEREEVAA